MAHARPQAIDAIKPKPLHLLGFIYALDRLQPNRYAAPALKALKNKSFAQNSF